LGWLTLTLLTGVRPESATAQEKVVHSVLFYSPTCPHCAFVMRDVLPIIFADFGGQPRFYQGRWGHVLTNGRLEILLVDTFRPEGRALYEVATQALSIPPERGGVPRLVCGDTVLVGSQEIPEQFPRLIAAGQARGGVPWPAIAGLAAAFPGAYASRGESTQAGPAPAESLEARPPGTAARRDSAISPPAAEVVPAESGAAGRPEETTTRPVSPEGSRSHRPGPAAEPAAPGGAAQPPHEALAQWPVPHAQESTIRRTLRVDPVGGSAALLVLAAMVLSLGLIFTPLPTVVPRTWDRGLPLIVAAGMVIAAYLAYVETTGALAVCGPVGDCNAVQQSRFARLGGIPIATLGLAGYAVILAAWVVARAGPDATRPWARIAAFGGSLVGTAASAALTVLEPFVIGAVCLWCLTSSVLMTVLLWLLAPGGLEVARAAVRGRLASTAQPQGGSRPDARQD
jgi:uncharacterized membrane protein